MTDLATIQELFAAGRHQECLLACQNALKVNPAETYAYKHAGRSLLALGQFEKAQQYLLKAHHLDSNDPEITKDIGNTFLNLGNQNTALGWYEKALKSNSNYAPAFNNIANIKQKSGNHQEAIQLFNQALKADAKLIQAYIGAAASYLALGNLDQAESFAAQALEINGRAPRANEIHGIIFQNRNQHDQAIKCYQKELEVNPKASNSLLNLGLVLLQQGQTHAALGSLEKASALAPSEQCSLILAQAYQNLGQFNKAITEYKKMDIAQSKNKLIPFNLGFCLLNSGNNIDAIEAFNIAIQLDRTFVAALGNLGIALQNEGSYLEAVEVTKKVLELSPNNPTAHMNLGTIYKHLRQLNQALEITLKSLELDPDNPTAHMNLGSIYEDLGKLDKALESTLKSVELNPNNPTAHMNLGSIYKDLGQLDKALESTLKSVELNPDNPTAHMNLGSVYKDLSQLDRALASTLKSLELNPNNHTTHMNLGGIYAEREDFDQALEATLKSLELKPYDNIALNNLKRFIDQLTLNKTNAQNVTKAYEILINLYDISHSKLAEIFTQVFLPTIKEAAQSDPIISVNNNALTSLAADWRLRKSLTLLIPPHQAVEQFLTRLRKELLEIVANREKIPEKLKKLTEALATQCLLNEYVYAQSPQEEKLVNQLIHTLRANQDSFKQYLAIIACYTPIHQIDINKDLLKDYPTASYEGKSLLKAHLQEPQEEEDIKATIQTNSKVTDEVSAKVQGMYEESPYPRYFYADHTDKILAQNICEAIKNESTKVDLQFTEALASNHLQPKVLIAGCGTGKQVISSSRYKNAQITAIDLSNSSLAYAIRKAKAYEMDNISFKKMDILNVADLGEVFDTIECSGVLHHMENPSKGLSVLNQQLKPGGYIKLALYSKTARQVILKARKLIKQLGLKSTEDGIREFRQLVFRGQFKELSNLARGGKDFYSLSTCRDLCFHVQEHQFTAKSLKELLDTEGLIFCGFILPKTIRNYYHAQFPADTDMNDLTNWGNFEKQNPSTFNGMYQFWAYKPN